jgi:hypothetical protein
MATIRLLTASLLLCTPLSGYTQGVPQNASPPGIHMPGKDVEQRTQERRDGQPVVLSDFRADPTGKTDSLAAIRDATEAARTSGKRLFVPAGNYQIDADGASIVLEEIELDCERSINGDISPQSDHGAVFSITGTGHAPFLVRRGVTIKGCIFYYPNQVNSASPSPYPPTLDFDFSDGPVNFVTIRDNVFLNSWEAIRSSDKAGNVGHVWIDHNAICGISKAIEIYNNLEAIEIDHNHFTFGFWLAATDAGIRSYMRASAIAISYHRGDGIWFTNNLVYGYLKGIDADTGRILLSTIADNSFDTVLYPIDIEGAANLSQTTITGNKFLALNPDSTGASGTAISLTGSGGSETNTINGNYFGQTQGDHINISNATGGNIAITGNVFELFGLNKTSGEYSAIRLNAHEKNVQVSGNMMVCSNNMITNGLNALDVNGLNVADNGFFNCNTAVSIAAAGAVNLSGNLSTGTVGAASARISHVRNRTINTPNNWDK